MTTQPTTMYPQTKLYFKKKKIKTTVRVKNYSFWAVANCLAVAWRIDSVDLVSTSAFSSDAEFLLEI